MFLGVTAVIMGHGALSCSVCCAVRHVGKCLAFLIVLLLLLSTSAMVVSSRWFADGVLDHQHLCYINRPGQLCSDSLLLLTGV